MFYSNDEVRENNEPVGNGRPVCSLYSDGPFPRLLYRLNGLATPRDADGAQQFERNLIDGMSLDTRMVHSEAEMAVASDEGWRESTSACRVDMAAVMSDPAKRGPGRPPKVPAA